MFCKWCGNTIKTTDKKCSSCGRETPPLSDCGGFYDLKRPWEGAALPTESSPSFTTGTPGIDPAVSQLREENKRIRQEANDRHRLMLVISGVLGVALLVVLILYIVAVSGDDTPVQPVIPQGGGQVVSTESTGGTEDPTGTTDPSAESTPTETTPGESQRPNKVDVSLLNSEDGLGAEVTGWDNYQVEKPEGENKVTVTFNWDGQKKAAEEGPLPENGSDLENLTDVLGQLGDTPDPDPENPDAQKEQAKDKLDEILGNGNDKQTPEEETEDKLVLTAQWFDGKKDEDFILLACDTDSMTGFENAEVTYTWQWRALAEEDWTTLEVAEDTALGALPRMLAKETFSAAGMIELHCTIVVTSAEGETFTITLSGFQVNIDDNFRISFPEAKPEEKDNGTKEKEN